MTDKMSIPYRGEVTLKLRNKNGKDTVIYTHNKALPLLGKLFAKTLLGYRDVQDLTPQYMDIGTIHYDTSEEGCLFNSALKSPVKTTSTFYDTDGQYYYTHFEAMISNKDVSNRNLSGQVAIVLKSASGQVLCSIDLTNSSQVGDYVNNQRALIIVWELKLVNSDGT